MRLSAEDLALLTAACTDPGNARGLELTNVLGTTSAADLIAQMRTLPASIRRDLETHIKEAIDEQRLRSRR